MPGNHQSTGSKPTVFFTLQFIQDAVPGTTNQKAIAVIPITQAEADAIAGGDEFRLRITRDADSTNATDDASGDARLTKWSLEIQ